ncbi:hypothetical protein ACQKKK_17050 [Peribacillus sp. NPDC006672]|uniref:hypothetical protein n=1 Tax=Peribacillus sp. NPDC006672 TaxID=3390606 RepID=UPI003D07362C
MKDDLFLLKAGQVSVLVELVVEKRLMKMSNAKYKFYYVNGETEELETNEQHSDEANSILKLQLIQNATWLQAGGKHINLANVISIEYTGEKGNRKSESIKFRPNK